MGGACGAASVTGATTCVGGFGSVGTFGSGEPQAASITDEAAATTAAPDRAFAGGSTWPSATRMAPSETRTSRCTHTSSPRSLRATSAMAAARVSFDTSTT